MKKEFIVPEIDVVKFEAEDVITASGNDALIDTEIPGVDKP